MELFFSRTGLPLHNPVLVRNKLLRLEQVSKIAQIKSISTHSENYPAPSRQALSLSDDGLSLRF